MRVDGNMILITGGGSGVGAALAHRLHDRGNHVIVAGRRQEALDKAIAGRDRMAALTLDVEDPQAIGAFAARELGTSTPCDCWSNANSRSVYDVSADV